MEAQLIQEGRRTWQDSGWTDQFTKAGRVFPEQGPHPREDPNLILDYSNNFSLRLSSGTPTPDQHGPVKVFITGCMDSP